MSVRFRVVLDALSTRDSAGEIADRHGVHPGQVAAWKRRSLVGILAALAAVFAVLWVTNERYDYPELLDEAPRPTMAHLVDPRFSGTTFQVEGVIESVQFLPRGLTIINLSLAENNSTIEVAVFPSLGSLPVKLVRGDRAHVTGTLGTYRGRPQIKPLSVEHVIVSTPVDTAVRLAEAVEQVGETLLVGPLRSLETEFFTSSANLRHLRLVLADPDDAASRRQQGIMFEGDQTACELDLLMSSDPFVVTARIDTFQEAPSLVVSRVFPVREPESETEAFLTGGCAAP